MNNVTLIGRLSTAVTMRQTQTGKTVATFGVAVGRTYDRDKADFLPVVVWGNLAENCARYIDKGALIGITGRLQSRNYDDKDGNKRTAYEVVADEVDFLSLKQKQEKLGELGAPVIDDEKLPF